ncbi:butyrophilin subfamily 2 member A2-like isoform X2 [Micropterus dolomieu]|uniref:butyrophilin subfamily 2 member A2-like isoform X2 n=1 Tax=Micropterus dolomieu TaxID=147949 RepID=UPI001E8D8EF4|nr:butyrophilin subfamily 2 member A2-like isoform X2 [Micropterus dolomieu]
MDWTFVVVLQVMFQTSFSVLFTVEAERSTYQSEFGGDVVMGCRFQPKLINPRDKLEVTWHRIKHSPRKVYRMDNGTEDLAFQDPDYRGRVMLRTEELKDGWAKLQVSKLRINDTGTYQCFVATEEGADYKMIILSVKAPYKAVTKHIEKIAEGDEVLLTCQSEGYPETSVMWQDGHLRSINANTTSVSTPDQLFKVTSQILVRSSDKNNYTCNFTNDGHSATFHIPDEIPNPPVKNDALIVVLSIGVIMVVITVAVLIYRRRKGFSNSSTRNLLVDGRDRSVSPAAYLQVNKENEEQITIINEGCTEENLEAFVKAHYSDFSFSAETRSHWDSFSVEELPHRLQNNKGQPVNLQALLPEARETLFLEGPPGSGKTTVAHILVSSWTDGPTHALSNPLDLGILRLLLYVDCSKVKGDLLQEIMTQLAITEKISTEDELRTVLSESSTALLLLDGYKEGNQLFDESVSRFLSERRGCRVLVLACPGHCPKLRDTVGTGGVLKLHTQTVKY